MKQTRHEEIKKERRKREKERRNEGRKEGKKERKKERQEIDDWSSSGRMHPKPQISIVSHPSCGVFPSLHFIKFNFALSHPLYFFFFFFLFSFSFLSSCCYVGGLGTVARQIFVPEVAFTLIGCHESGPTFAPPLTCDAAIRRSRKMKGKRQAIRGNKKGGKKPSGNQTEESQGARASEAIASAISGHKPRQPRPKTPQ